jgi:hypothetical protein
MEHRWGERIVVDIPVQVSVPPSVIGTGRVVNISISGAWVSGRFDLPPLARAFVVFELVTGGMHETLPIACFVARVRPEGIGVEWGGGGQARGNGRRLRACDRRALGWSGASSRRRSSAI